MKDLVDNRVGVLVVVRRGNGKVSDGARTVKLRWKDSRRGIAGAVTAVLFVIVITAVLAGITLYYVPSWSKQAESEHMSKVANQFLTIKDGVDGQISKGEAASSVYSHIALTSGATTSFMGIQGEPSKGTLRFNGNETLFSVHDTQNSSDIFAVAKGELSFRSHNAYYLDQEYIYEQGAVLVLQGSCSTVRGGSPPELHRDASGNLTLTVTFITLFGEDTSLTGSGSAGVETRILHADTTTMPLSGGMNLTLNATCRCGDGWARWVNSSLRSSPASENITAQNYSIEKTSWGFRLNVIGVVALTVRLAVIEMKVSK
jgi:hypothetical protein